MDMKTIDERGTEIEIDDETGRCLSVRVPAFMQDSQNPPARPHKPGSLPLTDEQRNTRLTPYLAHKQALSDAWRAPRPQDEDVKDSSHPTPAQAYQDHVKRLSDAWRNQ
jgi:hypothetical protein